MSAELANEIYIVRDDNGTEVRIPDCVLGDSEETFLSTGEITIGGTLYYLIDSETES